MITFEEDESTGYVGRTIKNASADATIAIAVNFETAGEKLTKSSVVNQGKKYIALDGNDLTITKERVDKIVRRLNEVNATTLNIAGNGLYTLKNRYTQAQIDGFVFLLLNEVVTHKDLITPITLIRTGGQTGFDEAGGKAGIKLNINTLILAPRGWKFRGLEGKDISDESLFKARFTSVKLKQITRND